MHTVHGTTVHNKYTYVYVVPITVLQAGEDGDDQDGDGQWRLFCNKGTMVSTHGLSPVKLESTKDLCDKAEEQARETVTMDST
jgi:hypothetical protein